MIKLGLEIKAYYSLLTRQIQLVFTLIKGKFGPCCKHCNDYHFDRCYPSKKGVNRAGVQTNPNYSVPVNRQGCFTIDTNNFHDLFPKCKSFAVKIDKTATRANETTLSFKDLDEYNVENQD